MFVHCAHNYISTCLYIHVVCVHVVHVCVVYIIYIIIIIRLYVHVHMYIAYTIMYLP